ncbi:hypothetical protein GBAR_LOCUS4137, partial [Geodia barretti]
MGLIVRVWLLSDVAIESGLRQVSMKKREKSPCQVEFSEERVELVNDGCQQQRHTYQLQNRGPGSVRVRAAIGADSDPVFVLLSGGEEKYVAPGLKLPVVLQYSPKGDDEACHHRGSLEVFVNSSLSLTIPISAVPRSPRLHLSEEVVDVGCLVTENQIHTTSFSLSNLGTCEGDFFIDTSPLPGWISLQPTTGHLLPLQSTRIQMEILCKEEIEFSYTLRQVILFNESPVSTDYLCLLDKRARGSEVGGTEGVAMALTEGGPGQGRWREQGSTPPHESIVSVLPSQGTLLPYEKRKLELTFAPRFVSSESGWSHFQATPTRRDYTLYLRFLAVDTNRESTASGGDLEVAVCATALPVDVQLEPSPPLQFGATPTMSPTTQHVKGQVNTQAVFVLPTQQVRHTPLYFTTHVSLTTPCHPPTPGHTHPHTPSAPLPHLHPNSSSGPLNASNVIVIDHYDLRLQTTYAPALPIRGPTATLTVDRETCYSDRQRDARSSGTETTTFTTSDTLRLSDCGTGEKGAMVSSGACKFSKSTVRILCEGVTYTGALVTAACGPERELGLLPLKAPSNSPTVSSDSSARWRKKRRGRGAGKPGIMTTDDVTTATSVDLREVEQCSTTAESQQAASEVNAALSPYQLSLITISPGVLDYGVIAVSSVVEKTVTIKNSLNQHICFTFKLAGSGVKSPLFPSSSSSSSSSSHLVLPPLSYTNLPFTVHRDTTGLLERCVECLVNTRHVVRLPVRVETVPLSLSLSTNTLTLSQPPV